MGVQGHWVIPGFVNFCKFLFNLFLNLLLKWKMWFSPRSHGKNLPVFTNFVLVLMVIRNEEYVAAICCRSCILLSRYWDQKVQVYTELLVKPTFWVMLKSEVKVTDCLIRFLIGQLIARSNTDIPLQNCKNLTLGSPYPFTV